MHEPLYAPVPDVEETLERLGLDRRPPSLDFLDQVLEAYISTIPFENYDVWHEGRCPSLAIEDLHRKLITNRRGGYCFELNGYLWALLNALGFQAHSVTAFVLEGEAELNEPGHRSILCAVDGQTYFCDGGYGGSIPRRAVPLDGRERGGFYLRRKGLEYRLYRRSGEPIIMFRPVPAYPVEFLLPNFAVSQDPENKMRKTLIANLRRGDGTIYSLRYDVLKITDPKKGVRQLALPTLEDKQWALREYFGIHVQ